MKTIGLMKNKFIIVSMFIVILFFPLSALLLQMNVIICYGQ